MQRKEDERKSNSAVTLTPSRTDHGDESLLRALTGLRYAECMHTNTWGVREGPIGSLGLGRLPLSPCPRAGPAEKMATEDDAVATTSPFSFLSLSS